jgi:hypothetical protein
MYSYTSEQCSEMLSDDVDYESGSFVNPNNFGGASGVMGLPDFSPPWATSPDVFESRYHTPCISNGVVGRSVADVNDITDDVIDEFAPFNCIPSADDDDDMLMQNWSMEDLESIWRAADAFPSGNDGLHDDDNSDQLIAWLSACPSDVSRSPSWRMEVETTSGIASGHLSRKSSWCSSGYGSLNSSAVSTGSEQQDDDLSSINQQTLQSAARNPQLGLPSKSPCHRHNSFGSSRDLQHGQMQWLGDDCHRGLRDPGSALTLTDECDVDSAVFQVRHRRFGSAVDCRSVCGKDGGKELPSVCRDDVFTASNSEFVRLLLRKQVNSSSSSNRLSADDDVDSGIGRRVHGVRRRQSRRIAAAGARPFVDSSGDGRSPSVALSPTHSDVADQRPLRPTSLSSGHDARRKAPVDDAAIGCDRCAGKYAARSNARSPNGATPATSTSRDVVRRKGAAESKSLTLSPMIGGGFTSQSPPNADANRRCSDGRRRRILEDHTYFSRDATGGGATNLCERKAPFALRTQRSVELSSHLEQNSRTTRRRCSTTQSTPTSPVVSFRTWFPFVLRLLVGRWHNS